MILVTSIRAPFSGRHQKVHVAAGQPWNVPPVMATRW